MTIRTVFPRASRATVLAALVVALLATLMAAVPARAASSVEIQLRPLMGGRYEVGGWVAVAVTLVNDGEPTEGNLTADTDGGTVRRFVEMPAGARKVVMLYVQPQAFQRRITVEYQEPNGTVKAEAELRVLEQSGSQVAIVGDGAGTLRPQVTGALDENAPEPIVMGPADIPERPEPLDGISALVWAADSSGLTEAQRRSLERWVAAGGELIVVGGADWQARTAAFANVLPLSSMAALDDVPHGALAAWSGSAAPPVATDTVSSGPLHEEASALITAEDGTVLLSMRPVGAGRTILVGSDLATEPYRGWEGSSRIWVRLIPTTATFEHFFGGVRMPEETLNSMTQALSNLPSLEVPPAELLLAVIVGYILLIGPVSYLILRRLDRRELAWVTAPLLVVLFTACSYGIGSSLKGSDVITNQISLIRTSTAGGAATIQTYAGIFSPQRSTYDLRVEADALLARLRPPSFGEPQVRSADVTIEQGIPAQLRDLGIGVFGFEGVRADAIIDYEPALTVAWRRDDDGELVGIVRNNGDSPLTDVAYVSSSIGERVGDLAPGEEAEFRVPAANFNGSYASDQVYGFGGFDPSDAEQRDLAMRRQVIDALVGYGTFMPGGLDVPGPDRGPFIIAWRAEEGPLPVMVDDVVAQRYSQTVEVLSVRRPIGTGAVTIHPAQMSISVIATEGDASSGGPGMMFLGDGSVTYSVTLPLEAANLEVSELTIVVGTDPHMVFSDQGGFEGTSWPAGFTAEVRDPQTGEWRALGDISQDSTFEIEDPATAISAGGRIEVRITGAQVDPNFGQPTVFVSAEAGGMIGE